MMILNKNYEDIVFSVATRSRSGRIRGFFMHLLTTSVSVIVFFAIPVLSNHFVFCDEPPIESKEVFLCDDQSIVDFTERGLKNAQLISNHQFLELFKNPSLAFIPYGSETRCYLIRINASKVEEVNLLMLEFSQISLESKSRGTGKYGYFRLGIRADKEKLPLHTYTEITPESFETYYIINHDNNLPRYLSKERGSDWKTVREIEWDADGNVVNDEKPFENIPRKHNINAKRTYPNTEKISSSFQGEWHTSPIDKKKYETLQKISKIQALFQGGRLVDLYMFLNKGSQARNGVLEILYKENQLKTIHGFTRESQVQIDNESSVGSGNAFFIQFNRTGKIESYIEGDIQIGTIDREKNGNSFDESTIAVTSYKNSIRLVFSESGLPQKYQTIVKDRLFGRQIEWNDKGEVISDVDLDIPKPWLDAPKALEEQQDK